MLRHYVSQLLGTVGWTRTHLWVLDLETGEGACFKPGGLASADLQKHKIWVCPLFEPFLVWLYEQKLDDLQQPPDHIDLPKRALRDARLSPRGPLTNDGLVEFGPGENGGNGNGATLAHRWGSVVKVQQNREKQRVMLCG
jgi:hypothetical protein